MNFQQPPITIALPLQVSIFDFPSFILQIPTLHNWHRLWETEGGKDNRGITIKCLKAQLAELTQNMVADKLMKPFLRVGKESFAIRSQTREGMPLDDKKEKTQGNEETVDSMFFYDV